ncbi:MAG TPA: MmgE/PrpD family protein [Azospirillum sp.]|nr:MmgE/PrpD family protein [Azospirillum sp.]
MNGHDAWTPDPNGPTARLAAFAAGLRPEHLDAGTRRAVRRHLLDTLAACLAGAGGAESAIAATVLGRESHGAVPVPGSARRWDRLSASYLAGVAAHGLEIDDGYRAGSVHPGAVVVPAALAAGHGTEADGPALMAALAVGYEVSTRLAEAIHPHARARGFHNTPVVGVLAAAAAAGSVLRLDAAAMEHAFGLAASSAAGLFAFLHAGGQVKRLHAGFAAREGLLAALLAQGGMIGPRGVLEAPEGFFHAFRGAPPSDALADGLWPLPDAPDLNVTRCYMKPHACCRHLHPAIDALLDGLRETGWTASGVERVEIGTYAIAAKHAATGWADMAAAQLSFPFVMATALRFGAVQVRHFQVDALADPVTAALCGRIAVHVDDGCDRAYPGKRSARVVLVACSGERWSGHVDDPLGSYTRPLDDDRLHAKVREFAEPRLGRARTDALIAAVADLDALPSATALAELAAG